MPRDASQQAQFELEEKYSQRLNIWRIRHAPFNGSDPNPPIPEFDLLDDVKFANWFLKSEFDRDKA